jgi:hypothetical protein
MVTAASALTETQQPTVFLSALSELGSAIETYSAAKTSEDASATAANNAMLAVRKMIVSCQSFKKPEDFLNFLRHCEQSLNISDDPFQAQPPFNGAVRDTREYLILLNQWLDHHNLGSLDHWASQINRRGKTDPETAERMGNIRTLLSQCHYSDSTEIQLTAENNKKAPHVRVAFDSRYELKAQWYHDHIASGGTTREKSTLEEVARLSTEFVREWTSAMDPDNAKSIVGIMAGSHASADSVLDAIALPENSLIQQTKRLQSYNAELQGPFDVNQRINLGPIKISSSAIALFFQKIIRGSALLLNNGFGLFSHVDILDSLANRGRKKDIHYKNVEELQNQAVIASDALHKMIDKAGVIVSMLDKCDLEAHLSAARMVADAIEEANIPGVTINKDSFVSRVRNSFEQPGYKAYFILHLLNSVRYEPLRNTCERLLPQMMSNGLGNMRDLIMPIDTTTGIRKAPSLFNMLNVLKNTAVANVANVSGKLGNFASLLNTPDLASQAKLLSKTFFQNPVLSPLFHVINKLGLTGEQFEHPAVTGNFGAKRVQSQFRNFWLQKVVPAVIVVCDPIVSLWNATKQVPVVNLITGLPARIAEGIHGAAGSILGVIPFMGKTLKTTWGILTPAGLLHKNLEFKGTYHANNAAQFCLDAITTPLCDLRSELREITTNISSSTVMHSFVSASQNLRNLTTLLPAFIMEQAKAERCGIAIPEVVFTRLGIPLEGKEPTIETFVKYVRNMLRTSYDSLYGGEGNITSQYTPPSLTDINPYGNNNAPFGIQYVNSAGNTITQFSNTYFDHENNKILHGDEARARNEQDFNRLKLDTEQSTLQFRNELSKTMKSGILSYIDSISSFVSGIQQTTLNVTQSAEKLVRPNQFLGPFLTRPTPSSVDKEGIPNGFISKFTRVAKQVGNTMVTFRTPVALPNTTFANQEFCHS